MVFVKGLITLSFICGLFVCASPSRAMIEPIDSIEVVKRNLQSLRKKNVRACEICVVLDFHGVVTNEERHTTPLTLKKGIQEFLQYLKDENIPNLVATAWNDFNAVIDEGIVKLGLQGFFEVKPKDLSHLEEFNLGEETREFVGYQNGRILALRKANSEDKYFDKKAFTIQVVYPNHNFKYIIFVDDRKTNLISFQKDSFNIVHIGKKNFKALMLYHLINQTTLTPPRIVEREENDVKDRKNKRKELSQEEGNLKKKRKIKETITK